MCAGASASRATTGAIGAVDVALLATPLDYLAAEVNRQRAALTLLESLTRDVPAAARARLIPGLRTYLRTDLVRHLADEAEVLLPLLRHRMQKQDEVDQLAVAAQVGPGDGLALAARVVEQLDRLALERAWQPQAFGEAVAAFAGGWRARLDWEVATLLPLARARLTSGDLRRLAQAMASRRGLRAAGRPTRRTARAEGA